MSSDWRSSECWGERSDVYVVEAERDVSFGRRRAMGLSYEGRFARRGARSGGSVFGERSAACVSVAERSDSCVGEERGMCAPSGAEGLVC